MIPTLSLTGLLPGEMTRGWSGYAPFAFHNGAPMGWASRLRSMWAAGAFSDPTGLSRRMKHRKNLEKIQRSLFYHRYASALFLAARSGVFDVLRRGELTHSELASQASLHSEATGTLIRILESQNLVSMHDGRIRLTEFGRFFVAEDSPWAVRPMVELMSRQAMAFPEVVDGLSTGAQPASLDVTTDGGAHLAFLASVNNYLHWAGREFVTKADLPVVRHVIAGSMGVSFSSHLLGRYPDAEVTYGCLEHLVTHIPRLRSEFGVPPDRVTGMHSHGGEPEADKWGDEAFDLVFLTRKMILAPQDRLGERFVKKAFDVLNPGGVAVLWETVWPKGPAGLSRAMEGVFDLFASPGAVGRTTDDYQRLLIEIGYGRVDFVECLNGSTTFVVAHKPRG